MNSSGVFIAATSALVAGSGVVVVEAVSGVGTSGTIYIWGMSLATASTNAQAGNVIDGNGNIISAMIATANGPYFLQLSTPIKVPINSYLSFKRLTDAGAASCYVTIFTTSTHLQFE